MSNVEIANAILDQISFWTKAACGFREMVAVERGLRVKVLRGHFLTVTLNGRDLYDVVHTRKKRGKYEWVTVESKSDIYCDQLSDVIYHMLNK